jgi:hypothetical protein
MNRSTAVLLTLLLSTVLLELAATPLAAQTTFTVTTATKTSEHPYFGVGSAEGFVIDGVQGKEITVMRGSTYTFQLNGVPTMHPFYLTTSPVGAGMDPYTEGVVGTPATGNATVTFTPTSSTPDLLYYQCGFHENMGWRIVVQTAARIDLENNATGASIALAPNPVDNSAAVTMRSSQSGSVRIAAYDLFGREALVAYDGPIVAGERLHLSLDASALASGAYELRARGAGIDASTRLVKIR